MHRNTITKSLFLKGESSFVGLSKIAATLSRIRSQRDLDCVVREIIEIARCALASRQLDLYKEASSLAASLPASYGLHSIAQCYSTLYWQALGPDKIRETLVHTADNAEAEYVPRMILGIGCTYEDENSLSDALRYYAEAARAGADKDPLVSVQAANNIAVLRRIYGDHDGFVRELESQWPLIQSLSRMYPHLYYEHLNNLAIGLSDTGRIEESRRAVAIALASPLADKFPEWRETQREIEEAAQKEPNRRPATLTVVPIPAPRARPCKTPIRASRNLPIVFPITFVRHSRKVARAAPWERNIVSPILKRYVKTVRIRQPLTISTIR